MSCIKVEVRKRPVSWGVEDRRRGKSSYRQQYKVCGSETGGRQKAVYCSNMGEIKGTMEPVCLFVQNNLPDFLHA